MIITIGGSGEPAAPHDHWARLRRKRQNKPELLAPGSLPEEQSGVVGGVVFVQDKFKFERQQPTALMSAAVLSAFG